MSIMNRIREVHCPQEVRAIGHISKDKTFSMQIYLSIIWNRQYIVKF